MMNHAGIYVAYKPNFFDWVRPSLLSEILVSRGNLQMVFNCDLRTGSAYPVFKG